MLYIFDREENLLEVLIEYEEFTYNKKLNSDRSLSFELEKNNNIKKYNKVGFFDTDKNFQLFFIDDIVSFKDAKIEKISVDCLADFFSLGNTLIDDKRATTIRDSAIKCLEGTDYKVGTVETFEDRNINFYHISRIKALNEIINTFKCEIDIRVEIDKDTGTIGNKYIDFKHRLGQDTAIRFTYDTALNNVEKSTLEGHFNVLWGWGKSLETDEGGFSRKLDFADINNNKKYVEDVESIKKYGRLEGIFEDSKIEDKTILLEKTKERLLETKQPKMSYKASIKDISNMTGYEHFKVDLGDTIAILDEDINEIIEARIISIKESEKDTILTLGNFLPALSDDDLDDILGNLNDKIDNIPKPDIPTADTIFPNTLPNIPIVEAQGLFSSVVLAWTYENKTHYTYEVFASKIKDFMPSPDNRIFEGKASTYLHEVNPAETWYYRIRGKNTYDNVTAYSTQVKAVTTKISDAAQYFEELAIGHALIHSLDLDKATVGKLKGQFIEAYNLIVTDGNGNETLRIDDFGRVYMNVTDLKIKNENIYNAKETVDKINKALNEYKKEVDKEFIEVDKAKQDLEDEMHGAFKDGIIDETEAKAINERLIALEKEKLDISKEYNTIYSNSNLNNTTEKTQLLNAKTILDTSYLALKNSILAAIADNKIIASELNDIGTKTETYNTASATYKEVFTRAVDKISSIKVNNLDTKTSEKISVIEQKADSITQRVSDVETTTSTHTATINNHTSSLNAVDGKINTAKNTAITDARKLIDTRDKNENPSWYFTNYPRQTITEFKHSDIVQIPGSRIYGTLETKVPWTDSSGGYPVQIFRSNGKPNFERKGISNTAWSSWVQIEDVAGSQNKATQALNDGKNYTNLEVNKVITSTNSKFAEINTTTDSITQSVSNTNREVETVKVNLTNKTSINEQTKVNGQELLPQNYKVNSGEGFDCVNNNKVIFNNNKITVKGNLWIKTVPTLIKFDRTKPLYWKVSATTTGAQFYVGIERYDKNKNVINNAENGACVYFVSGSTTLNGAVEGWWTETDKTTAYIQLRILCDWNNTGKDTIINEISWKQLSASSQLDTSKEILDITTEKVDQAKADIKITTDSISSKVSQVESTTNSINGKVTAHESRIASAEQKITPSAIINTVQSTVNQAKNDAINSANNSTDGKLNNYVTNNKFTEYKQDTDGFKLAVQKQSPANLLFNSAFFDNWTHWYPHVAGATNGNQASFYILNHNADWAYKDMNTNTIQIRDKNGWMMLNGELGVAQKVNTPIGKKYTISFYIASHRVNEAYLTIRGTSADEHLWNQHITIHPKSGGTDRNNWSRVSLTFVAQNNVSTIEIGMKGITGEDPFLWINQPMLSEGEFATPYAQSNREIQSAVMSIDIDKMKYTFEDGTYFSTGRNGIEFWKQGMKRPYQYITFNAKVSRIRNGYWAHVQLPDFFKGKQINHDFQLFVMLGAFNLDAYVSGSTNGALRVQHAEWTNWNASDAVIQVRPCMQKIGIDTGKRYGWDAATTSPGAAANEGEADVIIFAQM